MLGQSHIPWQNVENVMVGTTIPAHSVTELYAVEFESNNRPTIELQPVADIDHSPFYYYITDHIPLFGGTAGDEENTETHGRAAPAVIPMWVQYDNANVVQPGDMWGPQIGSYKLHKSSPGCGRGFIALSTGIVVNGNDIALFQIEPQSYNHRIRFSIAAVQTAGGSGSGSGGSSTVVSVTGTVLASLCGAGEVPEEDGYGQVTIYDGLGCLFDEAASDLLGLVGFASYMDSGTSRGSGSGSGCDTCRWEVDQLCCPTVTTGSGSGSS